MDRRVNDKQLAVLRWVACGSPPGQEPFESYKTIALALSNRRLVEVSKKKGQWRATLTDAGRHFLDHGDYPESHFLARKPEPEPPAKPEPYAAPAPKSRAPVAVEIPEVESPARVRRRGKRPHGDGLRGDVPDPWDERVMISVKEAAWLLSISEDAVRQAATSGDVDRVFIGAGTKNYRVVYGSLLAWVNSMPRHSSQRRWWS